MSNYTLYKEPLKQWSKGQYLVFPSGITEVDTCFYSKAYPDGVKVKITSYVTQDSKRLVPIPDKFLAFDVSITVYAYNSSATDARPMAETFFDVDALPKPSDYVWTAEEQKTWEELDTKITTETTNRTNADTALGTQITSEVTARQTADETLSNRITAETSARQNADTALGTRITTLEGETHSHSNKSVLDSITSALVTAWNTASTWVTTNGANVLSHLADTVSHITASERTLWNSKLSDAPSDSKTYGRKNGAWSEVEASGGIYHLTYNSTTFAQALSAYNSGKVLVCTVDNKRDFPLAIAIPADTTPTTFVFSSQIGTYNVSLTLDETEGWSRDEADGENTSNKVTSWSVSVSDTKYPSEKLTKDSLDTKYEKPNSGIPKTDLASGVQTSLGLADSALQTHQDISGKENTSNKVTSLSASSTDTEYPSAKCVYDSVSDLKPTVETYTIAVSDWSNMSGNEPFAYSTEITATHTIGSNTVCELINDNAVNFAKYGFAIGEIAGQYIKLFALSLPSASVTLEVDYYG